MKLIENTRKPDIYFRKNGQIDITSEISKALNLKAGDAINIWHSGGEYYLYKDSHDMKFRRCGICREVNKGSNFFRVNFAGLARKMIEVSGKEEAYLKAGEVIRLENIGTAVTLITKNNLYDK